MIRVKKYKKVWNELINDGHPSYSTSECCAITDSYTNRSRISSIYYIKNTSIYTVAKVFVPFKYDNDVRCDLHPRLNYKNHKICFNSVFEGKRGLYIVNLKQGEMKEMKIFCFLDEIYSYKDGYYVSKNNSGRFLLNLSDKYELVFSFPVSYDDDIEFIATKIPAENKVIKLPYWNSIINFYKNKNKFRKSILKAIDREIENCDVVWLRLPSPAGNIVMEIAKQKNKKIICHFAADILSVYKKYSGTKRILAKIMGNNLHMSTIKHMKNYKNIRILCTGKHIQDSMKEFKTEFFIDSEINPSFKRVTSKARNFIYVGRLIESKGVIELIDSWNNAQIEGGKLTIVGHGEMEDYIKQQSDKNNSIVFKGFVTGNDLTKVYNEADCLIMPTTTFPEGFPRVIVEAWCLGLSVISTDVGGVKSLGKDLENIILVKPNDINQLSNKIKQISKDNNLFIKLQSGSRQVARELCKERMIQLVKDTIEF